MEEQVADVQLEQEAPETVAPMGEHPEGDEQPEGESPDEVADLRAQLEALTAERDAIAAERDKVKADQITMWRERVSTASGVPMDMLTGETEAEMNAEAKKLTTWALGWAADMPRTPLPNPTQGMTTMNDAPGSWSPNKLIRNGETTKDGW
ncbi:hypothetical protein [Nocardia sp. NPDC127526]|uniref:hypothetical protein n=1 Tax=Nocardia sp. NPDC127526 TaxID=3345393 RepID=UPI003631A6B1